MLFIHYLIISIACKIYRSIFKKNLYFGLRYHSRLKIDKNFSFQQNENDIQSKSLKITNFSQEEFRQFFETF